jgi:hypothetical protein
MQWELPQKLWAHPHILAASMVTIIDPSKLSGSFYYENNGPIHMHWQLPKKIWAHPHILAASMVKIIGPSKFSGSFCLKNNGPTHKHLMAHPYALGAAEKIMGPSTHIGGIYNKNYGPIQIQRQLLFEKQWAHP